MSTPSHAKPAEDDMPENSKQSTVAKKDDISEGVADRNTNTDGGTVINGSASAGRDIIGRDLYVVNNVSYRLKAITDELIAEAEIRFEKMPVDKVPDEADMPLGSSLERRKAEGGSIIRHEELKAIAEKFVAKKNTDRARIVAITGIGGIGKTELAAAFARLYGQYFKGGVYWINMGNEAAVATEVIQCGQAIYQERIDSSPHQAEFSRWSQPDQQAFTRYHWQMKLPRLLIFDQCENQAQLSDLIPESGGCRVLVTSRYNQEGLTENLHCMTLGTFTRDQSIELLHNYRPDIEHPSEVLNELANVLGDLPMAITQAAKHLKIYSDDISPEEYVKQLQDNPVKDHSLNLSRTFALSYEKLDSNDITDLVARRTLECAANFAPGEPIPRSLLKSSVEWKLKETQSQAFRFTDALTRLNNLGLIYKDNEDCLIVHRLISDFVRNRVRYEDTKIAVEEVILATARQNLNEGLPSPSAEWQRHLIHVTDNASGREGDIAVNILQRQEYTRIAALNDTLGRYFHATGDYLSTQPYYQKSLDMRKKALRGEKLDAALSYNNLGMFLQDTGKLSEAELHLRMALEIREEELGSEHPYTIYSLNCLGMLLKAMGRLTDAHPYLEKALLVSKKVLGDTHLETAQSLNNFGALLLAMGKIADAKLHLEQALHIRIDADERNLDTAQSMNDFSTLLMALGNYDDAKAYLIEAFQIRKELLTEHHALTATSLNNLGMFFKEVGELESAEFYLKEAIRIRDEILVPPHPDLATSSNNLGELLQEVGDLEGAKTHLEKALEQRRQFPEKKHPDIAHSLNSIGVLLYEMGDLTEARSMLEEAVEIRNEALGEDHPYTATSLSNLGKVLQQAEDYSEAQKCFEKAMGIRRNIYGERHPEVAHSLNNIGSLWIAVGDQAKALSAYEEALEIRKEEPGETHFDTAASYNKLGLLLKAMDDVVRAQSNLEKSVKIAEAVCGPNHQRTLRFKEDLLSVKAMQIFKPFYQQINDSEHVVAIQAVIREQLKLVEGEISKEGHLDEKIVKDALTVIKEIFPELFIAIGSEFEESESFLNNLIAEIKQ